MPQVKAKELKGLTVDELREKYEQQKKELFNLRLQLKLQKLTDVSKMKKTKRLIARILTVIEQMEREKNG